MAKVKIVNNERDPPLFTGKLLITGEERRIPFILDDFHFCHSRVILEVSFNQGK
jgi:hypothetical protein